MVGYSYGLNSLMIYKETQIWVGFLFLWSQLFDDFAMIIIWIK